MGNDVVNDDTDMDYARPDGSPLVVVKFVFELCNF